MAATKKTPARKIVVKKPAPRRTAKALSATVEKKVADKPAPKAKDQRITILVKETPALRGSRADRWPLVAASKTVSELRTALEAAGYDTAGTLRWLQRAELIKLG